MNTYERYAYRPYRVALYAALAIIPAWIVASIAWSAGRSVWSEYQRARTTHVAEHEDLNDPATIYALISALGMHEADVERETRRILEHMRRHPRAAIAALEAWNTEWRRHFAAFGVRLRLDAPGTAVPPTLVELRDAYGRVDRMQRVLVERLLDVARLLADDLADTRAGLERLQRTKLDSGTVGTP